MEEYIIKSSVGIFLSYGLYVFLIRNNTRFKWVRLYFLMAVAASFLMPLISEYFSGEKQVWLQVPVEYLRGAFSSDTQTPKVVLQEHYAKESLSVSTVLPYIYLAGLGLVLLRFLIGFFHLLFLIVKHGVQKVGFDRLVIMQALPYPFSFLHLIFINRQTLSEANHGAMLEHERVHIRQWHWLDLILLELLVAVQWFNPFAWLFRRSVKELHEYLADEEVLKQTPKLDYQLLLFSQACGTNMYQPVNGFKSSLTKKRILMMNNQRNKKWFAVFAVLLVAIFAIQTLSRVNLAQDPPKVTKGADVMVGDISKRKYSPLPHSPLFDGTNNFGESNLAFGNFIINNVGLPPNFLKSTERSGIPIHVFFNSNGKITKVKLGDPYYIKTISGIKVTDRKDILDKISQVLYEAPPFKIIEIRTKNGELKICNEVGYAMVFENNKCQVIPHQYVYGDKN